MEIPSETNEVRNAQEPIPPSTAPTALELYELLKRLVDLATTENFKNLLTVPLDATLTTEQCAKWLQLTPREVNDKARKGIIPAIPMSGQSFRFHPRTILEKGHQIYSHKKRRRNAPSR